MHKILITLFLLNICLISKNSFAQTINYQTQRIAPSLLKKDFLLLRDTMQKIHPGIYRYKSKAAMNHIFDSTLATIHDSMTVPDFYTTISFIVASMGDGHTNSKLSEKAMNDFYSNTKVFPAMVMFIHNKSFIFCCNQNSALNGAELLSINNQQMNKITNHLFNYIQSDAFIQSHKNWELPESFHLLYNTLYGEANSFKISFKNQSGQIKTAHLKADTIKNVFCPPPFPRPNKYLQLSYAGNDVAVLTIKTFFNGFLDQTGENFSKFLDSAFTDIARKNVKKLIIDIRRNQAAMMAMANCCILT